MPGQIGDSYGSQRGCGECDWYTSEAGDKRGRAAGMSSTDRWTPPEE